MLIFHISNKLFHIESLEKKLGPPNYLREPYMVGAKRHGEYKKSWTNSKFKRCIDR